MRSGWSSSTAAVGTVVAITVAASACGGGDSAGQQREVADMFIEIVDARGLEFDRECVADAAELLSDDDAEKIVEAGTEGSSDISAAADEVGRQIMSCIDVDSYRADVVGQFEGDASIDSDCLSSELDSATTAAEVDERVFDAAATCTS